MPCGYSLNADGTPVPFEPDPKEMADLHAVGKEIDRPRLVFIDAADKPNELRYQYWENDRYIEDDFIPVDARITSYNVCYTKLLRASQPHDLTHSPDALRYWCSRRQIRPLPDIPDEPHPFGLV